MSRSKVTIPSAEVEVVDSELTGLAQNVVVDVGDVTHTASLVTRISQAASQNVKVR